MAPYTTKVNNVDIIDASHINNLQTDLAALGQNVVRWGAAGDGVTDDTTAIQNAINAVTTNGGIVYFPAGTYLTSSTLKIKGSGTVLLGAGRFSTILTSTVGVGNSVIESDTKETATMLWCRIADMKIAGVSTHGPVVDWKSMQLGSIERCWIIADNASSSHCVRIGNVVSTTEATYNQFIDNYIGLCQYGYRVEDGANNNQWIGGRCQNSFAAGAGILFTGSSTGIVNCNLVLGVGFEYPGTTVYGVQNNANSDSVSIIGCRFESLAIGIYIDSTCRDTYLAGNYFSSCTTDVTELSATTVRVGNKGLAATISGDRGDTDQTLTVGVDSQTQRWASTLTTNRTVTLSTTGALRGAGFRIVRTGLGAFTLNVGGLKTIANSTAAFVDVAYNGSAWVLTGYGAL